MVEERTCKNCIKNEVCKHVERLDKLVAELPHLASKEKTNVLYQNVSALCRLYQKRKL